MDYNKPNDSVKSSEVIKYELGSLCTFTQGVQIASSDTINTPKEGYIRYIYIRDLFTDKYPVYVKNEYPNKILSPTDIVMVNTGNTSGSVYRGKPGVLCNNAFRIATKKKNLDQEFLWFCLNSEEKERMLKRFANPSGQPHVGHKNIAKLKIPLFPLPEQQKIAKILTTWDKAIDTTERLIENSTQQKKALMQQLLTGKKRLLDDNGKPFEGEWEEVKLESIVLRTQLGTTERTKDDKSEDTVSLLKMGNLTWGGLNFDKVETLPKSKVDSSLILKPGDFLFNTRNTPDLVGKSAVWKDQKGEFTFDNNINRIDFDESINTTFICLYLTWGKGKSLIRSLSAGSTSVAAIYWKDLKNIRMPCPSLKEQQKIAAVLTNADKEIELLEQQLADLQQEKKALMQVLLTGKKRVFLSNKESLK